MLSDDVYIFLTPEFPQSDIKKVKFCLDCSRLKTEGRAPYDLQGTFESGKAAPLDTERLLNGRHTVRAEINFDSGGTLLVSGEFLTFNDDDDD